MALFVSVSVVFVTGCIDPIDFDAGVPERALVVEARLTDGPGPHYVSLSRSGAFTQGLDALRERERNAHVRIEVQDGPSYLLPEVAGGRYETPEGDLTGEVGEVYALHIELATGEVYRSPWIEMVPSTDILAVEATLDEGYSMIGSVLVSDPRVSIFADTPTDPLADNFYRWTVSGTYQVLTCEGSLPCITCFQPFELDSPGQVGSDLLADGGDPVVRNLAASLATSVHRLKFRVAFHVIVEQQSLNPEAYHHWSLIHRTRYDVGSLFDPPAEATFSNVANVDDPRERVHGYFTVGAMSTYEMCLSRHDFDDFPLGPGIERGACRGTTEPPPEFLAACGSKLPE